MNLGRRSVVTEESIDVVTDAEGTPRRPTLITVGDGRDPTGEGERGTLLPIPLRPREREDIGERDRDIRIRRLLALALRVEARPRKDLWVRALTSPRRRSRSRFLRRPLLDDQKSHNRERLSRCLRLLIFHYYLFQLRKTNHRKTHLTRRKMMNQRLPWNFQPLGNLCLLKRLI